MALQVRIPSLWTVGNAGAAMDARIGAFRGFAGPAAVAAANVGNATIAQYMSEADVAKAARKLGIATELAQEELADLAVGQGANDYRDYMRTKRSALDKLRRNVMFTYVETKNSYMDVGYDKEAAEAIAKKAALEIKEVQMGIFTALFPNSGEKVRKVY